MKTYKVLAPAETHWRPASCAEVACAHHLHGWETRVDETTMLGQSQAYFIRHDTRKYTERHEPGGFTVFVFEAGQRCFTPHQVRLAVQAHYLVTGGDWRGNPTGTPVRVHARPEDWVEDFAEHQQQLAERLKRG